MTIDRSVATVATVAVAPITLSSSVRQSIFFYLGILIVLLAFGGPSGGLIDIPISFFLKNKLQLSAHEGSIASIFRCPPYVRLPGDPGTCRFDTKSIGSGVIRRDPRRPHKARSKIHESERGRLAPADRSARTQETAPGIAKSRSRLRAAPAPSRRIDARRCQTQDAGSACGRCREFPDR